MDNFVERWITLWITFVKSQTFVLLWITLYQTRVRFLSCDACQVYATYNTNVINVYQSHCTYTNDNQSYTNEHQQQTNEHQQKHQQQLKFTIRI